MVYVYKESIVGVYDNEATARKVVSRELAKPDNVLVELRIVDEDGELTFHFDRSTPCLQD